MSWWRRKDSGNAMEAAPETGPRPFRVLVMGKAKTGTTYLSKVLQHSLAPCDYILEPKGGEFVRDLFDDGRERNLVVKVIFEHWDKQPNLRRALIRNEFPLRFKKRVVIVRDPRDELISRLLYIVKPLKEQGRLAPAQLNEWLTLLRQKEDNPASLSMTELIEGLDRIFSTRFLKTFEKHLKAFGKFYRQLPDDIHILKYEDLIDGNLGRLHHYLGFELDTDIEADMLIERTRRSASHGNWIAAYTTFDREALNPMMQEFLGQVGYDVAGPIGTGPLDARDWSQYVATLAER